nr:tyrosine-type recombinase/integrase [Chloroflexota bacterium]
MAELKRDQLLSVLRQTELAQDITAFVVDRQARGLSPRTCEYYSKELRHLQAYLEGRGVRRVRDVTADHIRQYLLHLSQRGRNAGGCHCAYRVAKTFLRWAWAEYGLAPPCPIAKVTAPRVPQQQLDPVPLSNLKAMLATCERHTFHGDRDRAILLCLLDTGARASEFLALDVRDVNLSTGAVIIRHGKGGKFRTAFVGAKARRELVRYLRHRSDSGALWVTIEGKRLTYAGLRQVVRRRALAAGVPVPSLHSFRRAFALACLRGGMDVYSLQKLMGHADLTVLRRYLQQSEADLQAAHAKSGPVDNLL